MFNITPKCSKCGKEIKGNEEVTIKIRYPEKRGITEIRAFLSNEGKITCFNCTDKDHPMSKQVW